MPVTNFLVITSIASDQHPVLNSIAKECIDRDIDFIVIGDTKSPATFELRGCDFWDISRQQSLDFELAAITPVRHYSRKNIGYLLAMQRGADRIVETDDDNLPGEAFWDLPTRTVEAYTIATKGWVNIYACFSDQLVWPRGLPLEYVQSAGTSIAGTEKTPCFAPIQQGLADDNPDVDAVFRLTRELPITFKQAGPFSLGKDTWCPFNSQNTVWFREAFPLMYLPSYCSFRMTDIWRSFVAQRIAWECGWNILFRQATVRQERNDHNLLRDFEEEVPGYLHNHQIARHLADLPLGTGTEAISANLIECYECLIRLGLIGKDEMPLLMAWIRDCGRF